MTHIFADSHGLSNASNNASTSRLTDHNSTDIAFPGSNQIATSNDEGERVLMTLFRAQNSSPSEDSLTQTTIGNPAIPLSLLLQGLQHQLLSSELKALLSNLLNQAARGPYLALCVDLSVPIVPFMWFQGCFDANPLSHSAFALSNHITTGLASTAHNTVNSNLHRAQTMFAHWRVWLWSIRYLEPALDEEIVMALSPDSRVSAPRGWLTDMVKYVTTHVQIGGKSCQLTAAEIFGDSFHAPDFTIRSHTSLDLGATMVPHIRSQCMDAVTFWLGFESRRARDVWRLQGAVLGAIFSVFQGSGVLLSPTIWRAYSSPESFAFPPNSNTLSTEDQVDNLRKSLCVRRGEDPSIRAIIAQFDSIILRHLPELHSSFYAATGQLFVHGPSLQQNAAEKVVAFMRDLYPILYEDESAYSDLCDFVAKDVDKRSPFRELAPSRARIVTSPCFASDAIYTQVGIFNALLFRAVTYGSDYLRLHKGKAKYFQSAIDFKTQVDLKRLDGGTCSFDTYFCRKDAYGTPTNRDIGNAPFLWDKSELWDDFIAPYRTANVLVPFHVMLKWIVGAKFKGVGDLTAFLLTGDLVYANVVSAPSPAFMGSTIMRIGAGPFSALKLLQVIANKVKSGAECAGEDGPQVLAFVELYHAVEEILLEREMELIGGFDIIIFEHTLCKMSRSKACHSFFK